MSLIIGELPVDGFLRCSRARPLPKIAQWVYEVTNVRSLVKERKVIEPLGEVKSFQFLVERAFGDSQPMRSLFDILVLGCKSSRDVEAFQFV